MLCGLISLFLSTPCYDNLTYICGQEVDLTPIYYYSCLVLWFWKYSLSGHNVALFTAKCTYVFEQPMVALLCTATLIVIAADFILRNCL